MKYEYRMIQEPRELSTTSGLGKESIDFHTHAISVPCQSACPVGTNVPEYIEKIAQGKMDEAYEVNLEDNVMPGVLGRICVRPCQKKCRHNWSDIHGPVEICSLKRVAADRAGMKVKMPAKFYEASGKKIAIVGGGPAGIAAARELARFGHTIHLFEKEEQLGGMLMDGIPRYRLPKEVIDEEVAQVLEYGIEVNYGSMVDREKLNELISKYDAVIVATGTVLPNLLSVDGLGQEEMLSGLEFMRRYNRGEVKELKGDVVIIGGGFTAVDSARSCARTARKMLGKSGKVTVVYRRSLEYMSADPRELEEMNQEKIQIRTLLSPLQVMKKRNQLDAVLFQKNYMGKNTEGKPEILTVEGETEEISCKHLIIAIGQKADFDILPFGVQLLEEYRTSEEKLFVIGDFYSGSMDVIHSIADGKNVARIIDAQLMKRVRSRKAVKVEGAHWNGETGRMRAHDVQRPPEMSLLEVKKRIGNNPEVELGFTDREAKVHSTRCYYCHYKFVINQEKCIHCNWCLDVRPRNCIKKVEKFEYDEEGNIMKVAIAQTDEEASFIWIDSEQCIRCGKCLRTCPTGAIEMLKTTVIEDFCL
ncbi:MAG: FAD-dependent oxidoreductase [Vallitaleaceae bacterium]|nr:FAD-dependent oxidoreductase [Vallitaleaceae bacterium]